MNNAVIRDLPAFAYPWRFALSIQHADANDFKRVIATLQRSDAVGFLQWVAPAVVAQLEGPATV